MDPKILVADRLIETVKLPTQRWYTSETEKRKFFIETSNDFLSELSDEIDNCVLLVPQTVDIFKTEKQKIIEEFKTFFNNGAILAEIKKLNLRLMAFGELARTVSIPKDTRNGVDLDLFAAVGFANTPRYRKYATKIKQFLALLTYHLFNRRSFLYGRRVQRADKSDQSGIDLVIDGISTKISVYMNNNPPVPYLASQLISVYEQYDTRFLSLCAFINEWLNFISPSIHSSKTRYAGEMVPSLSKIALLVVYFLQHYAIFPPVNLLHQDVSMEYLANIKHMGHGSLRLEKKELPSCFSSPNLPSANSAVLFFLFCDFYTNLVSPCSHVLELGSHSAIPKREFKSHIQNLLLFRDVYDDISPGSRVSNVFGLTLILNKGKNVVKDRLERFRFNVFLELNEICLESQRTSGRN